MSRNSTLGLNPERLARLLGVTLDSGSVEEGEDPIQGFSELIQAYLAGTLPFNGVVGGDLPPMIGGLRKDQGRHGEKTLGDVLTNPKSELNAIRNIRRYANSMASRKSSKIKHAVAKTIYFAAIAHALIFHDVKITTYSYESLRASFNALSEKPWIPSNLIELFVKARNVCCHKR